MPTFGVKGIKRVTGRMIQRYVEGRKFIKFGLDFAAIYNLKTQTGKNIGDFPYRLGDGMKPAEPGRNSGERRVKRIVFESVLAGF